MKKIFLNGSILTMESLEIKEALLIDENKIVSVGNEKEILNKKDEDTEVIDLKGKCLMPSFIDSHSHISAFTQTQSLVNLAGLKNFEEIINKLIEYKEENKLKNGDWIVGFGYDHNFLEEREHPNRYVLDKISMENPVLLAHQSGHMGVVNSKALEVMNINKYTRSPEGGKIQKDENNEPTGYLEENAFIEASRKTGGVSFDKMMTAYEKAEKIYLKNGITTAQDGLTKKADFELLKTLSQKDKFNMDIISYLDIKTAQDIFKENNEYINNYVKNYKIGGYKMILDGSPQGKTAWLSKPYVGEDSYCGYPTYEDDKLEEYVKIALKENMQILIHCNGDAAAEQMIRVFEKISKNINLENKRPVMIHAQTVRKDQLERMKKLGIIPSFFVAHTLYWGDIHIKNLGYERARKISPMKSAIDLGIVETLHQDTPVIMPNMLESIWCAVNRKTRNGEELDVNEQISIYEGLKAVTINSAYQYFEENEKGSFKQGKLANMIVLDKNPLDVNKEDIDKLNIMETWKNGEKVY